MAAQGSYVPARDAKPTFGDASMTGALGEVSGIPVTVLVVMGLGLAAFAFGWFKTRK